MPVVLFVALLAVYIFAFQEDIRHRAIRWPVFPVLFVLHLVNHYCEFGTVQFGVLMFNSVFVILCLGSLWVYFYLRRSVGLASFFNSFFGVGDFLFMLSLVPLFAPLNFIVYLVLAWTFSLLASFVFRKTVPLVSTMLVPLFLLWIVGYMIGVDFFYDAQLITGFLYL